MSSSPCDLFLVRHGATAWNETGRVLGRSDIPLNERGRAEADAAASALREFPITAVVASPQRRARETAERIASRHGLVARTDADLAEVWAGRWQGKTWQELVGDPDLQRYIEDPAYVCDAIEPAAKVQERMATAAERVRRDACDGAVVLVSHGDPIKLILAHYLAMALSAYRRIAIATGSISVVRFTPMYGNHLLAVNWRPPGGLHDLLS